MKVFFDGLDIHELGYGFFDSKLNSFQLERKKPFLNSSRYCLPYPFLPFFNFVYYPKPLIEKNNIDLIYAFKVFPLNKIPWVLDVEEFHYLNAFFSYFNKETFFSSKMASLGLNIMRKGLNSDYCKKIIPLSNYAKKTVLAFGGENLEKKTKVCFPAFKPVKDNSKKEKNKISLLFVATNPVYKGTEFVFSAFNEPKKKYDVELNCYGNFSEKTKKAFPEINFGLVSSKDFSDKVLPENDILLMPSLLESFGFTALQAFSNSMPVISSDIMALPEINQENKTGFLINFPQEYHQKIFLNPYYFFHEKKKLKKEKIVSQLTEKTALLIEDSSLRKKFGRNAFKEVSEGKFSFKNKEKTLKEIFSEIK